MSIVLTVVILLIWCRYSTLVLKEMEVKHD